MSKNWPCHRTIKKSRLASPVTASPSAEAGQVKDAVYEQPEPLVQQCQCTVG